MQGKVGSIFAVIVVGAFAVVGFQNCSQGKGSVVTQQSAVSTSSSFKALCQVMKSTSDPVVCIDLSVDDSTGAKCIQTGELASYQAKGASTMFFNQGSTVDCARQMAGYHFNLIGSCGSVDRVVRDYSNAWTAAEAQADCSARNGGWSI